MRFVEKVGYGGNGVEDRIRMGWSPSEKGTAHETLAVRERFAKGMRRLSTLIGRRCADEATRKKTPSTAHRDQVDQMKNASEKHAAGRCLMSSSKHLVLRREPTKLLSPTGKLHFSDRNLGDMGGG